MPIIRIINWPHATDQWKKTTFTLSEKEQLKILALNLRGCVMKATIPGITKASDVTMVPGHSQLLPDDSTLVVEVVGLFKRDDRPRQLRQRLADALAMVCREHLRDHWKIEVLVNDFDPEKEVYTVIHPLDTQPRLDSN